MCACVCVVRLHEPHIWSCFCACADEFDQYIVVSFVNATLVMSIGDTVDEVMDSGFLGTAPTLLVTLLANDALVQVCLVCFSNVATCFRLSIRELPFFSLDLFIIIFLHMANVSQVHPNGIRHIGSDKIINEWKTPGRKTIVRAAANERQVFPIWLPSPFVVFMLIGRICDLTLHSAPPSNVVGRRCPQRRGADLF